MMVIFDFISAQCCVGYAGFVIEPVLEELPKWGMVCRIVQELHSEGELRQPKNG